VSRLRGQTLVGLIGLTLLGIRLHRPWPSPNIRRMSLILGLKRTRPRQPNAHQEEVTKDLGINKCIGEEASYLNLREPLIKVP